MVQAKQERNTKELIDAFRRRMDDTGFKKDYLKSLLPETNKIIRLIIKSNNGNWFKQLKIIAQLQKTFYSEIIPEQVLNMMDSDLFHLKLLGSGGGFMLGFTKDYKETSGYFNALGMPLIRIKHSDLILE